MNGDDATVEKIAVLLRMFNDEYVKASIHEERGKAVIRECITNGICHVHVVAGVVAGVILGHVVDHPFLDQKVASEVAWYVHPIVRGMRTEHGGVGTHLLELFEASAKERGCNVIAMSTLANSTIATTLMKKHGYTASETSWYKGVK